MFIEIFTGLYILIILLALVSNAKQLPKSAFSGFVSGIILLAYSLYLHHQQELVSSSRQLVVFVAVTLLQLSAYEVAKFKQKVNWSHHVIRVIIHVIIVVGLLFY